ncbi:MAG: transketolase, partial [Dehalococcoidales bacterium]|nr:transketolase [Dehalococcoidales bacterium]
MSNNSNLDNLCINTIRFLSADAVEKARSGHPGMPMGAATMVFVLWDRFLKHNPRDPLWPNRDRFILSAGHGSMLLYSLLYLTGYDVTLEDIKNFRQWGSKTPGHPEYGLTPGVEATTGPLGQGFAMGVGMAIAERYLASIYNREIFNIVDHYTYAIVSDGDIEEGITSEAASLAGTLRLHKLIYLYDCNGVQQDTKTEATLTENIVRRFTAYGWNVIGPVDGLNRYEIEWAIRASQKQTDRPSLIICKTIIGYGSPGKSGTPAAHGEPLGIDELVKAKKILGWDYSEFFTVPEEVLTYCRQAIDRGEKLEENWRKIFLEYRKSYPELAEQFEMYRLKQLPDGWSEGLTELARTFDISVSTRNASGKILNFIADKVHLLLGGAADLAGSTRTLIANSDDFSFTDYAGRNIRYGLREHAMGAISNGLALHGGIIPFAATFLVFSDYMKPSIRLAALMGLQVIYIFTHDSIALGEDGPTHQPEEQLMALRLIPNLIVIRPGDAYETIEAWKIALSRQQGPTALILTRQDLPVIDRNKYSSAEGLKQGAYILWESSTEVDIILIATGSE